MAAKSRKEPRRSLSARLFFTSDATSFRWSGSLPPPHRAVIGINDISREFESTFPEDLRRCVGHRQRVGAQDLHQTTFDSVCDKRFGGLRGIATSFEGRHDSVGYLDGAG